MNTEQARFRLQGFSLRRRTMSVLLASAVPILLAGLWFTVPSTQSVTALPSAPTVIVAGGDPSPVGGVFASNGTPAIGLGIVAPTDTEAVAFFAFVNEGKAPLGIFLVVGDTITTVAAVGDPTPLGGTFAFFSPPAWNQLGEVAFSATIEEGDVTQGVFLFAGGQLTAVAALGEETPLKELADFPLVPALNNRGEVAFRAALPGTDKDEPGIFLASSGGVSELVVDGDVTAVGEQVALSAVDTLPLAFNDDGEVAFVAAVEEGSGAPGIFVASKDGQLTKIVAIGDPTPLGGRFSNLTRPGFNNAGEIAFNAQIVDGTATQGLFLASRGQITTIIAEGDPTPVGGTFALIVGMSPPPVLNDRGEVAFSAYIVEEQTAEEALLVPGVFVFSQGQIMKAVIEGDPTPLGGSFLGGPVSFLFDNSGTVLFMTLVDTDGDGYPNNQGIFAVQAAAS